VSRTIDLAPWSVAFSSIWSDLTVGQVHHRIGYQAP